MSNVKQEWLTDNGDGTVTVKLSRDFVVNGEPVKAITMREPTVGDNLVADGTPGTPFKKEIKLFSNLCEIPPDDLMRLKHRDYERLQAAFSAFTD